MNAQNYTQKSLEAIQAAQKLTIENQNQQIEQIHLLAALLRQPQLKFTLDTSIEYSAHIAKIIESLHSQDKKSDE